MQTVLLNCLFGAVCTMVLWVISAEPYGATR